MNFDDDFARSRYRVQYIAIYQNFRPTVLFNQRCFHHSLRGRSDLASAAMSALTPNEKKIKHEKPA